MHSAKCKFYTERIALASSSKELHQLVNILSNRHPPKILPTIYPSADHLSIFIKHFTNKVEKHRDNIASEHVTSTLVAGSNAATFSSFENVSQLTVKECILSSAPKSCELDPIPSKLAPSGFDVKSFPRQSRSRGGGIATVYKSTLGSSITFKTCFDFTHTSFEVVQASITLQHNTLHFFCLYRPPPNRRNNLTDSMFTEQLPNLLDYVNSLPGHVCLVGDMNIHFDNPLQSLTKQTLSTLSLYGLVQVINKPTHRCGHIIDWVIVRPDDDIHRKSTVTDSLESDHYCTKSYFNISVSKPSTLYRTVRNIANIDRPSFIAELSSVSEFSSVENANQFCDFCALY